MASYNEGKEEAIKWICANFSKGSTCLDVGACDGKWSDLLGDYLIMDAVEAWRPYIEKNNLIDKYRAVFECEIQNFKYKRYDLIIFGDILEHMSADHARRVIEYAWPRCKNMVIAVPYQYRQGPKNGNPYEVHIQDDLTPELFNERFPGFVTIYQSEQYAYYVKA